MAPVVKQSLPTPTPGEREEVPEYNEMGSGSHQLSTYNHVTEAQPVNGNVIVFLFLKICQSVLVFS